MFLRETVAPLVKRPSGFKGGGGAAVWDGDIMDECEMGGGDMGGGGVRVPHLSCGHTRRRRAAHTCRPRAAVRRTRPGGRRSRSADRGTHAATTLHRPDEDPGKDSGKDAAGGAEGVTSEIKVPLTTPPRLPPPQGVGGRGRRQVCHATRDGSAGAFCPHLICTTSNGTRQSEAERQGGTPL